MVTAAPVSSERISPTAYATGYFWYRHGLSHPALATAEGRRIDGFMRPVLAAVQRIGGFSMTALMLARHRGIDAMLSRAIDEGRVGQVIEIAAGLSPRGWDFKRRYGARLTYVETDLPHMVVLKRRLLEQGGLLTPGHRVVELDALAEAGPRSLDVLAAGLDPKVGTAVVTEGLMNYLDPDTARAVWRRIAAALRRFPQGVYFNDLYLREHNVNLPAAVLGAMISAFVRGRMHVHFKSADEVPEVMRQCGFGDILMHRTGSIRETQEYAGTKGGDAVMVLEARV
ncbi:MAG: class I SAM-dependent methyltransferase [Nevskia sp.]|nr:class I SAM-dependent methyltransferase [Nevskia sp.]